MPGLSAAQFGSSRLCGGGAKVKSYTQLISADELLAKGPCGPAHTPQAQRHQRIVANKDRILAAANYVVERPDSLRAALERAPEPETPAECRAYAQEKLSDVVLGRVRNAFCEAALAPPRSDMRMERLARLKGEMAWARSFQPECGPGAQDEFRKAEQDVKALSAITRAKALQQEARQRVEEARQRNQEQPANHNALAASRRSSSEAVLPTIRQVRVEDSCSNWRPNMPSGSPQAASQALLRPEDGAPRPDTAVERGRIVGEAMALLRKWKHHSEVAYALCDTLAVIGDAGGESFKEEMDKRGLGVLASTVADLHSDRAEVVRCALRLTSVQLLLSLVEESMITSPLLLRLGLEVLNMRAKAGAEVCDEMVERGGRELLDAVGPLIAGDHMASLHVLGLRRRLAQSQVKSTKQKRKVTLPPQNVVRLRGCFESFDTDKSGFIDASELGTVMQCLGLKYTKKEVLDALTEVDVDGSGKIEWPEFLWLLSRFKENQSVEDSFSPERLGELRDVFNTFDVDGSNSIDIKELGLVMRTLGLNIPEKHMEQMILSVDANASGQVEWKEFLYLLSKVDITPEDQHRLAWEFFQQDRDGRLPKEVLIEKVRLIKPEMPTQALEDMIFEAKCEDGDLNSITYKEFCKMMSRVRR